LPKSDRRALDVEHIVDDLERESEFAAARSIASICASEPRPSRRQQTRMPESTRRFSRVHGA
jgi:hypothetical protein